MTKLSSCSLWIGRSFPKAKASIRTSVKIVINTLSSFKHFSTSSSNTESSWHLAFRKKCSNALYTCVRGQLWSAKTSFTCSSWLTKVAYFYAAILNELHSGVLASQYFTNLEPHCSWSKLFKSNDLNASNHSGTSLARLWQQQQPDFYAKGISKVKDNVCYRSTPVFACQSLICSTTVASS